MEVLTTFGKVLIADDDAGQRLLLKNSLEEDGYDVLEAENGRLAIEELSRNPEVRLLLTDIAMPEMDGYGLIEEVRRRELRYTYIVVLTSMDDRGSLLKALSLGADDYLIKPVFPNELKLRLKSGARLLRLESQEELILAMAKLSEYRSEETGYHLERVSHYTRLIARDLTVQQPELGLSYSMADEIAKVSPLHDIGKVAIPDRILHKPGKLDADEWEVMKTHTTIGGNLIGEIQEKSGSAYLWLGYEIAAFHHERWDGSGYMQGLSGDSIPIAARIMALADVYDALTSERCYKSAYTHDQTKAKIIEESGKHFDPRVVQAFLRRENDFLDVRKRYRD